MVPVDSTLPAREVPLPFVKMHGLGNDFVMLRAENLPTDVDVAVLARALCDRHRGIGADGLIIAAPPSDSARAEVRFLYYNGDGSRAEMCGNGIRCFARFVQAQGLVPSHTPTMRVETDAGILTPTVHPDGTVTVDMGPPRLIAHEIPYTGPGVAADGRVLNAPLAVLGHTVPVSLASMGNPHCVIVQTALPQALDPALFGPALETHPAFPGKTNVEFAEILDRQTIRLTVWERGCGFTQACGTGACATAVVCVLLGLVETTVRVLLPGGPLAIRWEGEGPVWMTGPAQTVFEGQVTLTGLTAP